MALFGDVTVTVAALMRSEALELFAVSQGRAIRWCRELRAILSGVRTLSSARRLDARSLEIMNSRVQHAIHELDAATE